MIFRSRSAPEVSAHDLQHRLATELTERPGKLMSAGYPSVASTSRPRTIAGMRVVEPSNRSSQGTDWYTGGQGDPARSPGIDECGRED